MRDVTSTGPAPSRRLVTAGALGAVVAALSGCGIRLEDDAPHVPLVPTRSPIDGEDALLRLLAALQSAALAPVDPKVTISALLAPLHGRQATVLHDALRQRGVPEGELPAATPSPTSSASGSPSPSAAVSPSPSVPVAPAPLATVEGTIVAAGKGCEAAEAELRPTLLAVLAQAHAALGLATPTGTASTVAPSASPSAAAAWSTPAVLAPVITAVRTASYFLEIAAARSDVAVRKVWTAHLAELHSLTAELVEAAGDAAPAPELGLPLPHPVTTPAASATLATEAMATLLGAFGAALPMLSAADADAATVFATVPSWLGTVAALAQRHGIPLSAFPGLA
ncbi:hypothetical protein [Janibacter sp. HTCC2649]|uniref:hypothetical protein n=1 Tax=Janibacter sp. HTCC2649 TaxID=313589 RepID=UPI0011D1AA5C|nr:hypothetical protein [Janibacter sp. HTCC2649]